MALVSTSVIARATATVIFLLNRAGHKEATFATPEPAVAWMEGLRPGVRDVLHRLIEQTAPAPATASLVA